MAFSHSPKIATDGLVFYYDTGNGKSYKGEPTTNIVTNPTFEGTSGTQTSSIPDNWYFSGYSGDTGFKFYNNSTAPIALKFPDEGAVITTGPNGSTNRRIYYNGTVEPSTTYTLSYWIYSSNYGSISNYFFTYRADGTGTTSPSYGQSIATGEWVFVQQSFTTPADTGNAVGVNWGPVISAGTDSLFAMQRFQIEAKGHATQFVNGTRSNTNGLLDLTKNATIDLTGVSFNSDALVTFDGSNDQVFVDIDSWIRDVENITVEGVVEVPSGASVAGGPWAILTDHSTNSEKDGFWWHMSLGAGGNTYFRVEDTVYGERGTTFSNPSTFSAGNTYHIATVVGSGGVFIYNNGVLVESYNPPFNWADISSSQIASLVLGRTFPGYYLNSTNHLVKLYNKALTAEEVAQNYNAIKGRFGI